MNNIRVSVLMPAYNVELYIEESIKSILNQTFKNFELIILNDGSSDATANIIKQYAKSDNRIKFINNTENKGIAKSRNQLLNSASGEYVAYQDADDISLPDRLERQVDFLDKNIDFSVVGTAIMSIPDEIVHTYLEKPGIIDFYVANAVANPSVMFRKNDINYCNIRYNEKFATAEDYDFWLKVIKHFRIYNMKEVLVKYRVLENSLSHNNPKLSFYEEKIRKDIRGFLSGDDKWFYALASSKRILLLGFIPLLKIKFTRIYLFDIIPILKLKKNWWYLFDFLPFCKRKI